MFQNSRRREQVKRACVRCAQSKRKCNGVFPCERCVRLGQAEGCVEVEPKRTHRNNQAAGTSLDKSYAKLGPMDQDYQSQSTDLGLIGQNVPPLLHASVLNDDGSPYQPVTGKRRQYSSRMSRSDAGYGYPPQQGSSSFYYEGKPQHSVSIEQFQPFYRGNESNLNHSVELPTDGGSYNMFPTSHMMSDEVFQYSGAPSSSRGLNPSFSAPRSSSIDNPLNSMMDDSSNVDTYLQNMLVRLSGETNSDRLSELAGTRSDYKFRQSTPSFDESMGMPSGSSFARDISIGVPHADSPMMYYVPNSVSYRSTKIPFPTPYIYRTSAASPSYPSSSVFAASSHRPSSEARSASLLNLLSPSLPSVRFNPTELSESCLLPVSPSIPLVLSPDCLSIQNTQTGHVIELTPPSGVEIRESTTPEELSPFPAWKVSFSNPGTHFPAVSEGSGPREQHIIAQNRLFVPGRPHQPPVVNIFGLKAPVSALAANREGLNLFGATHEQMGRLTRRALENRLLWMHPDDLCLRSAALFLAVSVRAPYLHLTARFVAARSSIIDSPSYPVGISPSSTVGNSATDASKLLSLTGSVPGSGLFPQFALVRACERIFIFYDAEGVITHTLSIFTDIEPSSEELSVTAAAAYYDHVALVGSALAAGEEDSTGTSVQPAPVSGRSSSLNSAISPSVSMGLSSPQQSPSNLAGNMTIPMPMGVPVGMHSHMPMGMPVGMHMGMPMGVPIGIGMGQQYPYLSTGLSPSGPAVSPAANPSSNQVPGMQPHGMGSRSHSRTFSNSSMSNSFSQLAMDSNPLSGGVIGDATMSANPPPMESSTEKAQQMFSLMGHQQFAPNQLNMNMYMNMNPAAQVHMQIPIPMHMNGAPQLRTSSEGFGGHVSGEGLDFSHWN